MIAIQENGNSNYKYQTVLERIKDDIIIGRYKSGNRIPSFTEMGNIYNESRAVLQKAIEQLKHEGFLYSVDRKGVYTTKTLPHVCRYAFVFTGSPGKNNWSKFDSCLLNQIPLVQNEHEGLTIAPFFNFGTDEDMTGCENFFSEAAARRFAGVIIVGESCSHETMRRIKKALGNIPLVGICCEDSEFLSYNIRTERNKFFEKGLSYLQSIGRKKTAVLSLSCCIADIKSHVVSNKFPINGKWILGAEFNCPEQIDSIIELLFDYDHKTRPDSLIIENDNLFRHAMNAMSKLSLKVPEDVTVISHCNWPLENGSDYHVKWLGYDVRNMLESAIASIDMAKDKKRIKAAKHIESPVFYEEIRKF